MDDCADHMCIFQYITLNEIHFYTSKTMLWCLLWSADFPQHGLHEKGVKMGFELNVLSSYKDDKLGARDSCGNRSVHSKAQSKLIVRHNSGSRSHSHMGRRLGLAFV